ncbi:hypothetical protein MBENS4_1082 [Novosphingobium sp. MBES04]|nr:hypothetical protein MBENS4_1082 [Novosphingobium sp. MBES04]
MQMTSPSYATHRSRKAGPLLALIALGVAGLATPLAAAPTRGEPVHVPSATAPGTAADGALAAGDLPSARGRALAMADPQPGEGAQDARLGKLSLAGLVGLLAAFSVSGLAIVRARRRDGAPRVRKEHVRKGI